MNQLIDEELVSAMCEQIGHEKYNANIYLFMAAYLKNKGLENLASLFESQHDEETEHSKMIYSLLTDMNADVFIPTINEVSLPLNSILDVAKIYLDREILTTQSLDDIKKLAMDSNNPVVEEFMREMIRLQRSEYAEATDFYDKSELTGGDWKWVFNWDISLK